MFTLFYRKYQQRIPNELLASLAESLLDNTVFAIVNHLMDIQHVTEKQLFQQRMQVINKQHCKYFEYIVGLIVLLPLLLEINCH